MRLGQKSSPARDVSTVVDVPAAGHRRERQIAYLDRLLAHVPLHRALTRSVECLLLSDVELAPPVLDLGCGDGTFAHALFETPLAVGIDPDGEMVRWATKHGAYRSLIIASGDYLPFRSEAFASVLCNSTLEHIPKRRAVLQEMSRVLAPQGTCIITVPSEYFLRYHLGSSLARGLRIPVLGRLYERWVRYISRTVHCDPPDVWQDRLEEAGLVIRNWRYYFTAASTGIMDAAHYLSVPSLLTKRILGRWVLWRGKGRYLPLARWLAPLAQEGSEDEGAFLFFRCRKEKGAREARA